MPMQSRTHNYRELIWVLAKTDFKLRYHGSFLGYFWALLKPLLIFLVLNFVFANIFGPGIQNYSLQLLTGIIIWNFFQEGTMTGLTSLMSKAGIITKAYIPKWIIVIASTLNVLMTFILSLVILGCFFAYYGVTPDVLSIVLFLGTVAMIYGIIVIFSLITSPLFLRLRDLNQIWEVLLVAGFYAAPIIYPLNVLPEVAQKLVYLNPMTFAIQWSKGLLISGEIPPLSSFAMAAGIICILLIISLQFFKRASRRAAENI